MSERKFYNKDDYERIDFIIKTIGEKNRQRELAYVLNQTCFKYPYQEKQGEEEYYNQIIDWLELDLHLIRKGKNLVELTEEGMGLYEESNGIEAYIMNIREEKRLVAKKLKMEIVHKSILIATSVVVLITTIASCFADDFWNKLLAAVANIAFGALVAIACQLVKPIRKLFNPNGID